MKRLATFLLAFLPFLCFGQKPLVGISTGYDSYGHVMDVNETYSYSVGRAGGVPVLLPVVRDSVMAADLVSRIDALVMTGGEDADPGFYGESVWNETVQVNAVRDTSDFLILKAALRRGIPVLGICRGAQLLAVCFGDRLVQDIPSQIPDHIDHSIGGSENPLHKIVIDPGSRLHELVGRDTLLVNSTHHQAAGGKTLLLRIAALAPDGVVEAYEDDNNVMGLQFHPEKMIFGGDDTLLPVFVDLVGKAAKK